MLINQLWDVICSGLLIKMRLKYEHLVSQKRSCWCPNNSTCESLNQHSLLSCQQLGTDLRMVGVRWHLTLDLVGVRWQLVGMTVNLTLTAPGDLSSWPEWKWSQFHLGVSMPRLKAGSHLTFLWERKAVGLQRSVCNRSSPQTGRWDQSPSLRVVKCLLQGNCAWFKPQSPNRLMHIVVMVTVPNLKQQWGLISRWGTAEWVESVQQAFG